MKKEILTRIMVMGLALSFVLVLGPGKGAQAADPVAALRVTHVS